MSFDPDQYARDRQRLIEGHAYDPASERDACGVGLVAAIDGKPRREVIDCQFIERNTTAPTPFALLATRGDVQRYSQRDTRYHTRTTYRYTRHETRYCARHHHCPSRHPCGTITAAIRPLRAPSLR